MVKYLKFGGDLILLIFPFYEPKFFQLMHMLCKVISMEHATSLSIFIFLLCSSWELLTNPACKYFFLCIYFNPCNRLFSVFIPKLKSLVFWPLLQFFRCHFVIICQLCFLLFNHNNLINLSLTGGRSAKGLLYERIDLCNYRFIICNVQQKYKQEL